MRQLQIAIVYHANTVIVQLEQHGKAFGSVAIVIYYENPAARGPRLTNYLRRDKMITSPALARQPDDKFAAEANATAARLDSSAVKFY